MLSLEKCRSSLGEQDLSEEKVEEIRGQLYGLAEILVKAFASKCVPLVPNPSRSQEDRHVGSE